MFKVTTNKGAVYMADTKKKLKAKVAEQSRHLAIGEFWNNMLGLVDGEWVEV
jgi:hypothetical protein